MATLDDTPSVMKTIKLSGSPLSLSPSSTQQRVSLSSNVTKIVAAALVLSCFALMILRPSAAASMAAPVQATSSLEAERTEQRFAQLTRQVTSLQVALKTTSAELEKLSQQQAADSASLKASISAVRVTASTAAKSAAVATAAAAARPTPVIRHITTAPAAATPASATIPPAVAARSAAAPAAVTAPSVTAPAVAATPAEPAARAADDGYVRLSFVYDENDKLGDAVELYWLSGNATERLYATIPAGQRVVEVTTAGQCWRARAKRSGQHVASYCASSEPQQEIRIEPRSRVQLYFHYPTLAAHAAGAKAAAAPEGSAAAADAKAYAAAVATARVTRAAIYEVGNSILGRPKETLVGHVTPGAHLSTEAKAGAKYTARDELSGQVCARGDQTRARTRTRFIASLIASLKAIISHTGPLLRFFLRLNSLVRVRPLHILACAGAARELQGRIRGGAARGRGRLPRDSRV